MKYPETKELEVYIVFAGSEWYCTVSYNPGYEAPHCSNHDDPRFSDPGCGPEFALVAAKVTVDCGKTFYELTKAELEELEERYGEDLEEKAADAYANACNYDLGALADYYDGQREEQMLGRV